MTDSELVEWLMANAGPVIRYRTVRELHGNYHVHDDLISELLNEGFIKALLVKLDAFGPLSSIDRFTFNAIHNGTGLQAHVWKLLEFGLGKDIEPFDRRMQVFGNYVENKWVQAVWDHPAGFDVKDNWAIFIAVLLSSYLIRAGYEYEALINFVKRRIDLLHRNASEKVFDIHLNSEELAKLPKRPKIWSNKPVIRPEYDPGGRQTPLPLIHDMSMLAYLPEDIVDGELKRKVSRIVEYVLTPSFQSLEEGYGLLWSKDKRRFHGMGSKPELPCFHSFDDQKEQISLIYYLDIMSQFEEARESVWFQNSMQYLETYKTEDGTYDFPKFLLMKGWMELGENRRRRNALEIESTFRMVLLKKRIREGQDMRSK